MADEAPDLKFVLSRIGGGVEIHPEGAGVFVGELLLYWGVFFIGLTDSGWEIAGNSEDDEENEGKNRRGDMHLKNRRIGAFYHGFDPPDTLVSIS